MSWTRHRCRWRSAPVHVALSFQTIPRDSTFSLDAPWPHGVSWRSVMLEILPAAIWQRPSNYSLICRSSGWITIASDVNGWSLQLSCLFWTRIPGTSHGLTVYPACMVSRIAATISPRHLPNTSRSKIYLVCYRTRETSAMTDKNIQICFCFTWSYFTVTS